MTGIPSAAALRHHSNTLTRINAIRRRLIGEGKSEQQADYYVMLEVSGKPHP